MSGFDPSAPAPPIKERSFRPSRGRRVLALGLGLALLSPMLARADGPAPDGAPILRVGLADDPPFSAYRDGRWSGLSVDIWTSVADGLGATVEWQRVARADTAALLAAHRLDVGPVMAVTTGRVRTMDFSPPVLASGVAIATIEERGWDFRALAARLWDSHVFNVIGGILLFSLVVGFLLWHLERRHNPASFGGEAEQGLVSGIWCAMSTVTTVGYGDKVPVTWAGRLLCFITMLSGVVIISLFTAAASSALTVAHLRPRVHDAAELKEDVSAVVAGSAAADYLRTHGMPMLAVPDDAAAETALEHGKVAAFVDDRIQLRAWYHDHPRRVAILPLNLEEVYYAYPLPSDPDVRRRLSVALQEFLDSSRWQKLQARHLTE